MKTAKEWSAILLPLCILFAGLAGTDTIAEPLDAAEISDELEMASASAQPLVNRRCYCKPVGSNFDEDPLITINVDLQLWKRWLGVELKEAEFVFSMTLPLRNWEYATNHLIENVPANHDFDDACPLGPSLMTTYISGELASFPLAYWDPTGLVVIPDPDLRPHRQEVGVEALPILETASYLFLLPFMSEDDKKSFRWWAKITLIGGVQCRYYTVVPNFI